MSHFTADVCQMRELAPEKFKSRVRNKGIYLMSGVEAFLKQPCKNVMSDVIMTADGEVLDVKDYQGILLLNIASWGAGADPWGSGASELKDKDTKEDDARKVVHHVPYWLTVD